MNDGGDWLNWVRLAALGVIWGGAFTLVGVALNGFAPLTLAATRLALAAMLLVPLSLRYDGLPKGRRVWLFALGVALFSNALPYTLLSWAQTHIPSAVAGILMAAMPLIALPMSHLLVPGERMTMRGALGLAIGFVGVVILIGPAALLRFGGGGWQVLAQLACLVVTVCYVSGSIVIKRAPPAHPVGFAAAAMLLAAAMSVPVALAVEGVPRVWPDGTSLLATVALTVGPTVIALLILLRILETAGPTFVSLVNYQVPVWAAVFGAVFLGEQISPRLGIALVLILFGVAIAQNLVFRSAKPA